MSQHDDDETRVVPLRAVTPSAGQDDATVVKPLHAAAGGEGTAAGSSSLGTGDGAGDASRISPRARRSPWAAC